MWFNRLVGIGLVLGCASMKIGIFGELSLLERGEAIVANGSGISRAASGLAYINLIVLGTAYLLVFPHHAAAKFSPRRGSMRAYVMPPAIWAFFGYVGLAATGVLYAVFK